MIADGEETIINLKTEATRTTTGEYVTVPLNRYATHDTQPLSRTMRFFTGDSGLDRVKANYSANPPNQNEPTIITAVSVEIPTAVLKQDTPNSVEPLDILNAVSSGIFQVRDAITDRILLEVPVSELFQASIDTSGGNVVLSQRGKTEKLDEVIFLKAGRRFDCAIKLAEDAEIPTDANWAASDLKQTEIRVRFEHRGNNGR